METETLILAQLVRIADAMERLASGGKPTAPNIVRPIEEFRSFDWGAHNFEVVTQDNDGPTHVTYNGTLYTRRSPSNKFEPAIWYSAPAGKDADGNVEYIRLITFRTFGEADPLPAKVNGATRQPATTQPKVDKPSAPVPAQPKAEKPAATQKAAAPTQPATTMAAEKGRPYSSAVLWTKLVELSGKNSAKPAAADVRSKMQAALRACFTGDPYAAKQAEDLIYSVAKVRDINLVKAGMVHTLLTWLDPKTDSGGAITVSDLVVQEAKLMLVKPAAPAK